MEDTFDALFSALNFINVQMYDVVEEVIMVESPVSGTLCQLVNLQTHYLKITISKGSFCQ